MGYVDDAALVAPGGYVGVAVEGYAEGVDDVGPGSLIGWECLAKGADSVEVLFILVTYGDDLLLNIGSALYAEKSAKVLARCFICYFVVFFCD